MMMMMVLQYRILRCAWDGVHGNARPKVVQVKVVFQIFDATVRIAMGDQKVNTVRRSQNADALTNGSESVGPGSGSAQYRIEGGLADHQIERRIVERKALSQVGVDPFHRTDVSVLIPGGAVLGLHLLNHDRGEIQIDNATGPPVPLQVFSKGGVSAAQDEDPTFFAGWEGAAGGRGRRRRSGTRTMACTSHTAAGDCANFRSQVVVVVGTVLLRGETDGIQQIAERLIPLVPLVGEP